MSLAQLVQNAASANLNVLVGVADEDGEEADLCMGVVQLLLVRVIYTIGNIIVCVQCQELIVAESLLGSLGPFSNPGLKSIRNY